MNAAGAGWSDSISREAFRSRRLRVLISGAGIAGPALAFWLLERSHAVTIVERSAAPRLGGQAIDVRGVALEVLRRMGLLDAARALRTTMRGVSVIDVDGVEQWRSEEETLSGGRFDAGDVEILRDDLAAMLLERLEGRADLMFSDAIASIEQSETGCHVGFASGATGRFDIVVGADGIGSNVRQLGFDVGQVVHSLGVGLAVFTAPNLLGLRSWQVACREQSGGFLIYTARDDRELRVTVGFPLASDDRVPSTVAEQKEMVARRCAHLRWEIPRLLRCMREAPDFYFGPVAQVRQLEWSAGRIVLLGDAAFSPSAFSGQGTSLALVGAYVLAAEIALRPESHRHAFVAYQRRLARYVELNQALASAEGPPSEGALDEAKWAIELD